MIHKNADAKGRPLRVGLENPDNAEEVIGVATLSNRSLCASAGNRRKWEGFHHVIDPVKLKSPAHVLAVWVVADATMLADGLTTCLFFVSPDVLRKKYSFEYVILNADHSVDMSDGFPGEMFVE
jgi:thiamine biosynthesis lipoprotein